MKTHSDYRLEQKDRWVGVKPVERPSVAPQVEAPVKPTKRFEVGQSVWCTVSAISG